MSLFHVILFIQLGLSSLTSWLLLSTSMDYRLSQQLHDVLTKSYEDIPLFHGVHELQGWPEDFPIYCTPTLLQRTRYFSDIGIQYEVKLGLTRCMYDMILKVINSFESGAAPRRVFMTANNQFITATLHTYV